MTRSEARKWVLAYLSLHLLVGTAGDERGPYHTAADQDAIAREMDALGLEFERRAGTMYERAENYYFPEETSP